MLNTSLLIFFRTRGFKIREIDTKCNTKPVLIIWQYIYSVIKLIIKKVYLFTENYYFTFVDIVTLKVSMIWPDIIFRLFRLLERI